MVGVPTVSWWRRLVTALVGIASAVAVLLSGGTQAAALNSKPSPGWITDGPVRAVQPVGNRVYIGGSFSYVGPVTGSGAPVQRRTGLATKRFPKVTGSVAVAVSDGSGGYFIAGDFRKVGGAARSGLAHVRGDGSVAPGWHPRAVRYDSNTRSFRSASVFTMALSGSMLYVGGDFDRVGGASRRAIAAIDAGTGVVTSWDPQLADCEGCATEVHVLAVGGRTVYFAGFFDSVGGQHRYELAAVDASTGAVASWSPSYNGNVGALTVSGSTVYVGGNQDLGDNTLGCVAAFDTTGGTRIWKTNASGGEIFGDVNALAVSGSVVYVGGDFTRIGGRARHHLATVNPHTGTVTAWNPDVESVAGSSASVSVLALAGPTLYVGGQFTAIDGRQRSNVAALRTATGTPTSWRPGADRYVRTLAVSPTNVYVGGDFNSVGGLQRRNLAALDSRTGAATSWTADANGSVYALASSGFTMYAGGDFTELAGRARGHIAALSLNTGKVTGWNPDADRAVYAIAVSGSHLYVGGSFSRIGGVSRSRIAAVSRYGGATSSWNPRANGEVDAIVASGSLVYMGGKFTLIGGTARKQLAAVYAGSATATLWNPDPTFEGDCGSRFGSSSGCSIGPAVLALAVSGSTIYVGGVFTSIGASSHGYLAAVDAATGLATQWNPGAHASYDYVASLDVSGSTVFAGGGFGVAAISARTGTADAWRPEVSDAHVIAVAGSRVCVGADFIFVGYSRFGGFASFGPLAGPAPTRGLG
jgi:hypothetical protein